MFNQPLPSMASSSPITVYSKIIPLFIFVLLAFMLVNDAEARSRTSTTTGGTSTSLHDHGISVQCTWPDNEGTWESDPENVIVKHYADNITCSGWDIGGVQYTADGNVDHYNNPPYGVGQFNFNITYASDTITPCIADADSGIGNDCIKFTDAQNTGNGGSKKTTTSSTGPTAGATLACENNYPGTTLTYQYYCADGADVTGYLTLVPTINNVAQAAPLFTGPCSAERVAAGKCTMKHGGVPTQQVKIKGTLTTVIDTQKCLDAFPQADVNNALESGQSQPLAAGAMLFYQEIAYTGSCDPTTELPTDDGSPVAAHGRYCQSDISNFDDNVDHGDPTNVFPNDPQYVDGFDNELRVCEQSDLPPPHTGDQDVETDQLANFTVDFGPTLNLNCTTGGNTDSGKYKVSITDQATVLAANIDVDPLSDAPTLEGVSPINAVINTDDFGVQTLVLTYPTCNTLSGNVIANNSLVSSDNNTNVFLHLSGQTIESTATLNQDLEAQIEVKVNGL